MLFADPLSRICGPTEGWHDPALPSKIATLLRYLPEEIRQTPKVRLYAGKDTGGVSKILYQWRKKKGLLASSITSGKLPTTNEALDAFNIGVEDVNKVVSQCRNLIANGKQFAVLMPVSIAGEIARLENSGGERQYDDELLKKVEGLSRIILAQDAEMWLVNLNNHRINAFVPIQQQGTDDAQSHETVQWAIDKLRNSKANQRILEDKHANVSDAISGSRSIMLPITRSQRNIDNGKNAREQPGGEAEGNPGIRTSAADSVVGEVREGPT